MVYLIGFFIKLSYFIIAYIYCLYFFKKNKWQKSIIISWLINVIVGFINVIFFFEKVRMSYDYSETILFITEVLLFTLLEPIHFILLIVSILSLIKKRKD